MSDEDDYPDEADERVEQLSDQELLERAFRSKVGDDIERLWRGAHDRNLRSARMALIEHLAFWCRESEERISRLFSRSALGPDDDQLTEELIETVLHLRRDEDDNLYDPGSGA